MKVVYGHTDSIYIKCDSVEKAKVAIEEINDHVRESFPNALGLEQHPVVLEFEKFYSSLGVGTTKNRNVGLVSWLDGVWLDEPKFVMTGFTAKKISETGFARDIQSTVLRMWVDQCSFEEINEYLHQKYSTVLKGEIDFESIVKRSRFKEERFKVKCSCGKGYSVFDLQKKHKFTEGKRTNFCSKCAAEFTTFTTKEGKKPVFGAGNSAILFGVEKLNLPTNIDSYVFIKCKPAGHYTNPLTGKQVEATYVAGRTFDELREYSPDWSHYADQVIKKAEPVYKAMEWDTASIKNKEKKLSDWW